jgi:hypothetical protein
MEDEEMPHLQTPSTTKTHHYKPPTADSNTFATQQAFLDSLKTVAIEDVPEDKRKCPICWKYFGEAPDPGFDNSELPVQLRCNHVFGQKCLANIFGIPETSRLALRPLSFAPGDKGYLLGERLEKHIMKHVTAGGNGHRLFDELLKTSHEHSEGAQIYGHHWWTLIHEIFAADRDLVDITLLENAIILDYEAPKSKTKPGFAHEILPQHLTSSSSGLQVALAGIAHDSEHGTAAGIEILPQHLTASSNGLQQTLAGVAHESGFGTAEGINPAAILQPSGMHEQPVIVSPPAYSPNFLTQVTSAHMAALALTDPSSQFSSLHAQSEPIPPMPPTPNPSNDHGDLMDLTPDSEAYKSWQAALATETNLDKLSALHKEKNANTKGKAPKKPDSEKVKEAKAKKAAEEARTQEIIRMKSVLPKSTSLHRICVLNNRPYLHENSRKGAQRPTGPGAPRQRIRLRLPTIQSRAPHASRAAGIRPPARDTAHALARPRRRR